MSDYYEELRKQEKSFLHDVRDHTLTVLRDEKVDDITDSEGTGSHYRHIKLAKPGTINMSYQIISVPYYLTMVGDMGSWTWSRLRDNFFLFRADSGTKKYMKEHDLTIHTNAGYWAEKLQAVDYRRGLKEYDEEALAHYVVPAFKEWLFEEPRSRDEITNMKTDIRNICSQAEDEHSAYTASRELEDELDLPISDTWEWTYTKYSSNYLWACHAVSWAVQQYDQHKENTSE